MTVAGCANEKSIPGWKVNNAVVSVEAQWPHRADGTGRTNIIKVGDAGSFSEIHQTVDTVVGQVYTISYDVWSEESETNTANKVRNVDGNLTRFWHIWGIFWPYLRIFSDTGAHPRFVPFSNPALIAADPGGCAAGRTSARRWTQTVS